MGARISGELCSLSSCVKNRGGSGEPKSYEMKAKYSSSIDEEKVMSVGEPYL